MSAERPFFSLIVPCYNDGRYKPGEYLDRLLASVAASGLNHNDIEVILADDHSTVTYEDIIEKYEPAFSIKLIYTEYNFAPGNTRQVGTHVATGEWICFADHDDLFYPRALRTVKDLIQNNPNNIVFAYADFDKVSGSDITSVVEEFHNKANNAMFFVHGKFYNRDKFWKPYNLAFPKDLKTHEDIALGAQVECALICESNKGTGQSFGIPTPIYMWVDNKESVSNQNYQDTQEHSFLETAYNDYLTSGISQYIGRYKMGHINKVELSNFVIPRLLSCWFQLSQFKLNNPDNYIKDNFGYVQDVWNEYKEAIGCSTVIVKLMMAQSLPRVVDSINKTAKFYNIDNFDQWIDQLDKRGE